MKTGLQAGKASKGMGPAAITSLVLTLLLVLSSGLLAS